LGVFAKAVEVSCEQILLIPLSPHILITFPCSLTTLLQFRSPFGFSIFRVKEFYILVRQELYHPNSISIANMHVRQITHGSAEYQLTCELRNQVLRLPLGLNLYDEDLSSESAQWHFGLLSDQGELLACVIVVPLATTTAKIRQMAVRPNQQQSGLGSTLLKSVHDECRQRGVQRITMHARVSAIGFYQRLGYTITSEEFVEVTIPHVVMEQVFS
jgi:predicted GNAT family N-acyltransferase